MKKPRFYINLVPRGLNVRDEGQSNLRQDLAGKELQEHLVARSHLYTPVKLIKDNLNGKGSSMQQPTTLFTADRELGNLLNPF